MSNDSRRWLRRSNRSQINKANDWKLFLCLRSWSSTNVLRRRAVGWARLFGGATHMVTRRRRPWKGCHLFLAFRAFPVLYAPLFRALSRRPVVAVVYTA